jgi:2-dehydropantoate 2-reductase
MRVAVMGSGGLGGYFGALLAKGGTDVSFIARGAHLEAMRRDGLRVEEGPDPFHLKDVRATDDPAEIGPVDLVMVCVKLWDMEAALQQLRPLVGPDTALVSFQNGVLKDSMLRAAYDELQLIGGVAYVATTVSAPGVVSCTGPLQRLIVGEFDRRRSARVEAFHAAAGRAGSMRRSATTFDVRSGRSSYSSSGYRRPQRRCAPRLGRSARTHHRGRCCWI